MKKYLLLFLTSLLLIGCRPVNEIPPDVEQVLKMAGKNRQELEQVLKKYNRFKKDSLKFQAACYLIKNMPGHYGIYHHNEKSPDAVFEKIKNTLLHGFDSVAWKKAQDNEQEPPPNNEYIRYDLEIITAGFLIDNIENAFYAWNNYPWCENISFNGFKKYVLPYRIDKEPLMNLRTHFQERFDWVVDSMAGSTSMKHAFELIYNKFYYFEDKHKGWGYGSVQNLYDVVRLSGGLCYHTTLLKSYIMLSMGVACTFDETPQWANRSNSHSWNAFVAEEGTPLIIDGSDSLQYRSFIHSSKFTVAPPGDSLLPGHLTVYPYKKVAKVYRKSFTKNPHAIFYHNQNKEQVPPSINDLFRIDVTGDYLPCSDVTVETAPGINKRFAYICLFDRGNIVPIDWGQIRENNQVTFHDLAHDILYIAVIMEDDRFYPITHPFILREDGSTRSIATPENRFETVILHRKYPLFGNILNYANHMYKGRFQGSNKADFSDATDLLEINNTFLLPVEFDIQEPAQFRYLRYLPDTSTQGDIGDISFLYDSSGVLKTAEGKYLFKFEGPDDRHVSHAFDGKASTFYSSTEKNTWIGLDLGKNNKKRVRRIKFNPRTDTNYIIPGNEYELFYWDNGWQSLGKKVAGSYTLRYDRIPKGALLWLYCHSGGQEERPFTYENGKQVWW